MIDFQSEILIGYSITIHGITIKHFDITGRVLLVKKEKWDHGQIEYSVSDIFCVRLKKQKEDKLSMASLKIFYIH